MIVKKTIILNCLNFDAKDIKQLIKIRKIRKRLLRNTLNRNKIKNISMFFSFTIKKINEMNNDFINNNLYIIFKKKIK